MTLFGEIDALADDIVAPVINLSDKSHPFLTGRGRGKGHTIAHSNRIRAAYALEAEVTFDFTIKELAIVG